MARQSISAGSNKGLHPKMYVSIIILLQDIQYCIYEAFMNLWYSSTVHKTRVLCSHLTALHAQERCGTRYGRLAQRARAGVARRRLPEQVARAARVCDARHVSRGARRVLRHLLSLLPALRYTSPLLQTEMLLPLYECILWTKLQLAYYCKLLYCTVLMCVCVNEDPLNQSKLLRL